MERFGYGLRFEMKECRKECEKKVLNKFDWSKKSKAKLDKHFYGADSHSKFSSNLSGIRLPANNINSLTVLVMGKYQDRHGTQTIA